MPRIKVKISDITGGKSVYAEIPDDISINRLLPTLVKKMALPQHRNMKHEITGKKFPIYRIQSKNQGRILPATSTLAELDIQDGDQLRLLPELGASQECLEKIIKLASGKLFSEHIILIAVKVNGITTSVPVLKNLPLSSLLNHIAWEIVENHDRRSNICKRFLQLCESAGLGVLEGQVVSRGQLSTKLALKNETAGVVIDMTPNAVVGDSIQTGDCVSINFRQQDSITIDLEDEQQEILDQIHIYPTSE